MEDRHRGSSPPPERFSGHRRAQVNLQALTPAEAIILENTFAKKKTKKKTSNVWISSFFLLWTIWMMIGTLFYRFYPRYYTWSEAFYMNVNVGWGLNWKLDENFRSDHFFSQWGMQLYSLVHTATGSVFIGYCCIYIATQLLVKKNQWLKNARGVEANAFVLRLVKFLPEFLQEFDVVIWKFLFIFTGWTIVGIIYYASTHDWHFAESIDYVFSTSTGAGYTTIQKTPEDYNYAMFALYCVVAVPLMTVSFGLIATSFFEPPHYRLMDRMFANVCQEELDFMVEFGLIDTGGQMSQEEFIILMAVRIDRASPELITTIYNRFLELDRKSLGSISVDDLLDSKFVPRRHKFSVNKYNQQVVTSKESASVSSIPSDSLGDEQSTHTTSSIANNSAPGEELGEIELTTAKKHESSSINDKSWMDGNEIILTKQNLNSLTKNDLKQHERKQQFEVKRLTVEVDMGDEDTVGEVDSFEQCSPIKKTTSPQSQLLTPNGTRMRPSLQKKNVFSIMDTMQKEYIFNGDDVNNPFSPLKAAHALTSRKSARNSGSPELLRRKRNRRGSGKSQRSSVSSIYNWSRGGSVHSSSPSNFLRDKLPSPVSLFRSRSAEYPAKNQASQSRRFSASPTSMEAKAKIISRRQSVKTSSPNTRLTKMYKINSDSKLLKKEKNSTDNKRYSLGNETERGYRSDLSREEILAGLVEMNKVFQSKALSGISPSTMKLFKRVSSIDHSISTFFEESSSDHDGINDDALVTVAVFGVNIFQISSRTQLYLAALTAHPLLRIFGLWSMWVLVGATFFTLYQKDTSFWCGMYLSISVGVGMFWMTGSTCNVDQDEGVKSFLLVHMLLGAIALGVLRAYVAHTMAESRSLWYMDTNIEKVGISRFRWIFLGSCSGLKDLVSAGFRRLGSRGQVHCLLTLFLGLGLAFGCFRYGFSFLEGLFFSFSALTCGGFVAIPDEESTNNLDYAIVALFAMFGVPLMAVSLSFVANSIVHIGSGFGAKAELDKVMSVLLTEKEIDMLNELGLEVTDVLNKSELTVLILLRVGAMTPAFVQVIVDWYQGISHHMEDILEEVESDSGREDDFSDDDDVFDCEGVSSPTNVLKNSEEEERDGSTRQHRNKSRNKVTFHKVMSFSVEEAGDNLRDRANKSFATMLVE